MIGVIRNQVGFSLVEVTLALGIFVFALTAILGLMPGALHSTRDSLDQVVALQLADRLYSSMVGKDFTDLDAVSAVVPGVAWFDDAGAEVEGPEDAGVYKASYWIAESASPNLRRARITVERGGHRSVFCYLLFNARS